MSVLSVLVSVPSETEDATITITYLEPNLETLQGLVGGTLEAMYPSDESGWFAYINEDGKGLNLPMNPEADMLARMCGWISLPGDYLAGPVLFLGDGPDGEETDVPLVVLDAIPLLYQLAGRTA